MSLIATRADVARLFGRAAFGATGADLTTWAGQPYAAVVDSLFPPGPPGTLGRMPQADDGERAVHEYETTDVGSCQRWWLERMRVTPYPIEERMTLFWHDHFATAFLGEPDAGMLMIQNETLRLHALGNFRDLANAMTVDPAMLYWLNGIANHAGGVNENYAREFFELFTLGVLPQVYTESDIRLAAKVFTGWVVNPGLREPSFSEGRHDMTVKSLGGREICGYPPGDPRHAVEYKEVTEVALASDGGWTAARFLAYKMVLHFGYQPDETDLAGDQLIQDVAAAIRPAWSLRDGIRTLLLHDLWRYAPVDADRGLVRSPVELAVHAMKILGFPGTAYGLVGGIEAVNGTRRAGQLVLEPPNVGGWPNGLGWLSQTTTMGRYDLLVALTQVSRTWLLNFVVPPPASGDIDGWAAYMGMAGLSAQTRLRLQEYLADPGTIDEIEKQVSMFILVGTSPDWQVM